MMPMRARTVVTSIFFLNGAVFSSWYARLPAIQEHLGLSEGSIGVALLGASLGLLVAQPMVGAVVARRGSRPVVASAPLYLAAVVLPALAVDGRTLLLAVIAVGAANGALDIAMNVQGLALSSRRSAPFSTPSTQLSLSEHSRAQPWPLSWPPPACHRFRISPEQRLSGQ